MSEESRLDHHKDIPVNNEPPKLPREVYRGNGFVVTTNDSGEIFVGRETDDPHNRLRISAAYRTTIRVSYMNTNLIVEPTNYRTLDFRRVIG